MTEEQRPAEDHHGSSHRETSPYIELDREAWAALAQETSSPLTGEEIHRLRGLGDALDLEEIEQVYLPLSRLLSLYVGSAGQLHRDQENFLHQRTPPRTPFVIGLAGSVAVGKSTTARAARPGDTTIVLAVTGNQGTRLVRMIEIGKIRVALRPRATTGGSR